MKWSFIILFFLSSCMHPKTQVWLKDYEALLKESATILTKNPSSAIAEEYKSRIQSKESEMEYFIHNITLKEQMKFLSEYYDIRIKFESTIYQDGKYL